MEDARWWEEKLGRSLQYGEFGENLTTEGIAVNDALIDRGHRALTSKIASIVIAGTATGSAGGGFFGITARKIGPAIIGGESLPLTSGADNRLLDTTNANFRLADFS